MCRQSMVAKDAKKGAAENRRPFESPGAAQAIVEAGSLTTPALADIARFTVQSG